MPITVEGPDGSSVEFPDDTPTDVMRDAMRRHFGFKGAASSEAASDAGAQTPSPATGAPAAPQAMFDASDPDYIAALKQVSQTRIAPHVPSVFETEFKMSPEQEAQARSGEVKAARAAQEAHDARTLGERATDAAGFAASMPVRIATKGEYGAGDLARVAGLGGTADALTGAETSFVQNNEAGLEALKAFGDVTAGIPMLSTMGAIPGQMLRTSAAAARQLPAKVGEVLTDTTGAAKIPGGKAPLGSSSGGTVPPPPAPAAVAVPTGPRPPTNAEVSAATGRLQMDPLMRAITGNRFDRGMGAAVAVMPGGERIASTFENSLRSLGDAAARTTAQIGKPSIMAGEDLNASLVGWLKNTSKAEEKALYEGLGKMIDPTVKRPTTALSKAVKAIKDDMAESTSETPKPALDMVAEAVGRPEGLTFKGKIQLRTDIGNKIAEAKLSGQGGTAMPAYKRLYEALTDDIEQTAKKAGGEGALAEFRRVNKAVEDLNTRREEIQGLIGKKGQANEGAVINRIQAWSSTKGGDLNRIKIIKQSAPEAFDNAAAELSSRLGIDPATKQLSHNRFLTDYGKYSEEGKQLLFGSAKPFLDDIATVSSKLKEFEKLGNPSGTGRVVAVMNMLKGAAGLGLFIDPVTTAGAAASATATIMANRRIASYLAKPAGAKNAGSLLKAYYNVESSLARGGAALARNEEALDNSIRSFAAGIAAETGQAAADVEKTLRDAIGRIRSSTPSADAGDAMSRALRSFGAVA